MQIQEFLPTLLLAYTTSHKARRAVPKPKVFPFAAATRTFGKLINSSTKSLVQKITRHIKYCQYSASRLNIR